MHGRSRSRKRMSTAPGSTLPRPFLSDMSISSPLNVTKNPNVLASLLSPYHNQQFAPQSSSHSASRLSPSSPSQSSSYPHFGFTEKRMMRRSRSAQGLVGMGGMNEYRSEQKIKRKPVPRLSGQGQKTPRGEDVGMAGREETLLMTSRSERPLRSRPTAIGLGDTGTSVSQAQAQSQSVPSFHYPSSAFLTPPIQDPNQDQDPTRPSFAFGPASHSPPTIPTTITSGSLNLGLIPSGSGSSLASSYIEIETPIKVPIKLHSNLNQDLDLDLEAEAGERKDKEQGSPTRRYGSLSLGIGLDRYIGQALGVVDDGRQDGM